MRKFIFAWMVMILLTGTSGCAWFQAKKEKTADDLITEGMQYFEREKYRNAIESFEKLKDWYPYSKFAILAELKKADARYHLGEYAEAVAEYQSFETLHPRNEAIPYVIYQIGMCYFNQMDTIDRDQTAARKSLATFRRLAEQFPQDQYTAKATPHMQECQKSLVGHEMYVGLFYYKSNHYKTALNRFENVLSDYPDIDGIHEKARRYIERCEKALKKESVASKTL